MEVCADDVNDHHALVLGCVLVLREHVRLSSADMDIQWILSIHVDYGCIEECVKLLLNVGVSI